MAPATLYYSTPSRRSRRGAVGLDMIVMILMIVAVLGVGTFAFIEAGNVARDEGYVESAESFPAEAQMALRASRSAMDSAFEVVGMSRETFHKSWIANTEYKGEGPGDAKDVPMVKFAAPNGASAKDLANPLYSLKELKNEGVESDSLKELRGAVSNAETSFGKSTDALSSTALFDRGEATTIESAIAKSDEIINALVAVTQKWGKLEIVMEKANAAAQEAYNTTFRDHLTELEAAVTQFKERLDIAIAALDSSSAAAKQARETAFAESNRAYDELLSDIRDATLSVTGGSQDSQTEVSVDAILASMNAKLKALSAIREDTIAHFARRTGSAARKNDFKGYVVDSNKDNGWAWISIGQDENVRPGMNFEVQRPSDDATGTIRVATIQVTAVLPTGGSRCRVLSAIGDTYPRKGDALLQPNFSLERYQNYSLIGDFGGTHSRFSRIELQRMLEREGLVVHDIPSNTTEVLILGANWQDDKRIAALASGNSKTFPHHVKFTEKDLLYMLRIDGPASER